MKSRTLLLMLFATVSLQGQDWPQFRGPGGRGIAEGPPPPVRWDLQGGSNIRWKTPIPGISVSSPVVWRDRIFVSTAVSSDPNAGFRHGLYGDVEPSGDVSKHSWKVYCLDKKSGRVLWEKTAHEGVPKTKRHPKSSQATPTPATDGKHLVVFFGSEGLYTYDLDGNLLWKKDLGTLNAGWFYDPDFEWGMGSSPILYKDRVIVQCDIQRDSFVAAFALTDGKQIWRTSRDEIPSWGTPAIYEGPSGTELITQATNFIRGYDPMTGAELWRLSGNSEITVPTPFVADDLIFVTNGYRIVQPIFAIKPGARGDISLKEGAESNGSIAWSKNRGGPYLPTPLVYGGYLYVVSNNGILTTYEARTGNRVYQQRLGQGGAFSASPVAASDMIYFTSEDGDVYVVKAGPTYELLATNTMGEVCIATPAVSDGMLFLRTMKHVIGIGEKSPK